MNNKKAKQVIAGVLSGVLGFVFLISAYTKTMPVAYFEYVIDSQLHMGATTSAIAARLLIGFEAALGLLLLLQIWGYKKWVPKMGLLLTLIFSVHLVILWQQMGNDVNCGCMGNLFFMSPLSSLLKNAGILLGFFLLLQLSRKSDSSSMPSGSQDDLHHKKANRSANMLAWILTLGLMSLPFILYPLAQKATLQLSRIQTTELTDPSVSVLGKGKHIVAFMSLGCGHCRDAATAFARIQKQYPQLPVHLIFSAGADSSRAEKLEQFMMATGARQLVHSFIPKEDFVYFMKATQSNGVPIILWMQDSTIYRRIAVPEINEKEIIRWFNQSNADG